MEQLEYYDDQEEYMFEDDARDFDQDETESTQTRTAREDLHEGGDFHLKSALKNHTDLMTNYVYRREYEKLSLFFDGDTIYPSPHECMIKLTEVADEIATEKDCGGLVQHANNKGEYTINSKEMGDLIQAEVGLLHQERHSDISSDIETGWRKFNQQNPGSIVGVIISLLVLPLLNNIKNFRTHGIPNLQQFSYCTMFKDMLFVHLTNRHLFIFSTDSLVLRYGVQSWFMPKDYFVNALDKMQERFNVLLYSTMCKQLKYPIYTPVEVIKEVINWGDDVINQFGNSGYELIGNFEAIIVGLIIQRDDDQLRPFPNQPTFLQNVLSSLDSNMREYAYKLRSMLGGLQIHQLSDIHGLYRIWGHPVVDIDGGMEKLRANTVHDKKLSEEGIKMSHDGIKSFRRIYFTSFFKQHSCYPEHIFLLNGRSTYIGRQIEEEMLIDMNHPLYDNSDWEKVEPAKQFSIPKTWNILHLAKDKSISPNRDEIFHLLTTTGSIFNADLRRGIIKLMSSPLIAMREFLTKVATNGLPDIDCIIGLFPKERELKISARFFALMSFFMRVYFTATEGLLGDKILRYFPQITMNLNLLDMQKKMAEMSRATNADGATITYVLNMDFVKWNQQMRLDICEFIFRELDKLFGLPGLFTQTHRIFKKCVIYLANGCRKLYGSLETGVMLDGKNCWKDAGAGKEGLRQKGWTIMTVCDIDAVAMRHGGRFQLVGGGDNQVLTVSYKTKLVDDEGNILAEGKEEIRQKMEAFILDLQTQMDSRGLPLKMSETWCSTSLFMYNKYMYYKGSPLRSPLKQVSRVFPFSNTTTMTLSSMMQCISTNLRSSMQRDCLPHAALFLRNFWGKMLQSIALFNPPMTHSLTRLSVGQLGKVCRGGDLKTSAVTSWNWSNFWLKICYLPSCLGGPGSVNVFSILMRGFPDPVTENCSFLIALQRSLLALNRELGQKFTTMLGVSFGRSRIYNTLIEDPTSLNLDVPRSGTQEHRVLAREALLKSNLMKEENLKNLVTVLEGDKEKNFYRALASAPVLDVRVLHEFAASTLYAVTNTLTSRIEKTSTLTRLYTSMDVMKKMSNSEMDYILYLLVRDNYPHDITISGCTRVLADEMRSRGWGKPVIGVTVPTPFEFLKMDNISLIMNSNDTVIVKLDDSNLEEAFSTIGCGRMYLGSYTKEKFKMTDIAAAYGDEDILKKSISLMKTVNWRYPKDTTLGLMLTYPFRALTDADVDPLIVDSDATKGDYEHRKKTDSRVHGGIPNFLQSCTTHCNVITSTWTKHSKGGKNENIHFQAVIIICLYRAILSRKTNYQGVRESVAFTEDCKSCIIEIDQPNTEQCTPSLPVSIPSLKGNSLAYISCVDVEFDVHVKERFEKNKILGLGNLKIEQDDEAGTAIFCAAWLLWLNMLGMMKTTLSTMSLMGSKHDPETVLTALECIVRCWLFVDPDVAKRKLDVNPFVKFFSDEKGCKALRDRWGLYLYGNLEGGLLANSSDLWEALLYSDKWLNVQVSINVAMPALSKQKCIQSLLSDNMFKICAACMGRLKDFWNKNKLKLRIDADLHCVAHQTTAPGSITNKHPENIRATREEREEQLGDEMEKIAAVNYIDDLHAVPDLQDFGGKFVTPKLYSVIMQIDTVNLLRMLLCLIQLLGIRVFTFNGGTSILSAIVTAADHLGCFDDIMIFFVNQELSFLETDTFEETINSLSKRVRRRIIQCTGYRACSSYPAIHIYPKLGQSEQFSHGDCVLIPADSVWELSYYHRIEKVYKLKRSGYYWICACVIGAVGMNLGGIFQSFYEFGEHHSKSLLSTRSAMNMLRSSLCVNDQFLQLWRSCSWALFKTRFELLTAVESVKKALEDNREGIKKKREKKMRSKKILTFVLSVLSRVSEDCTDVVSSLDYVTYNHQQGMLKLVMLKKGKSLSYLHIYGFFVRTYLNSTIDFYIGRNDVLKSINILSAKNEGFNVTGTL